MSPRGVATPDVNRRLFDAAERVLAREGPAGLTSRAITGQAGTATGLLFSHFGDLDAFLAAFVLDRLRRVHDVMDHLPERAGSGSVAENLTDAAMAVAPAASVLIDVVHSRPSVGARLRDANHTRRGGHDEIERSFTAYLEAERAAGRLAPDTDAGAVSIALAASVHQLSLAHPPGDPKLAREVRRVVMALVSGLRMEGKG